MPQGVLLYAVDEATGDQVPVLAVEDPPASGTYVLKSTATLVAGDIQIGAVEIKDHDTADRMNVDTENRAEVVTPNRPNFDIFEIDTGAVPNTEVAGPSSVVPNGFAVYIEADSANGEGLQVAKPGNTGTGGKFRTVGAGNAFPVALKVDNLSKIAVRAPTLLNQKLRLIVEQVA